ncbi:MAG: hypothetical protein Q8M26_15400 [Pseudolabrys sp.]|nr:hypothetical protein [Pseudolabrys sp.]
MSGPLQAIKQAFQRLFRSEPARSDLPPVIIHDPAAQKAHDLDDPFFDEKVQTRIGDVIAGTKHKPQ